MAESQTDIIKKNLDRVQEKIVVAAQSAGRDPEKIKLVVVTKLHPVEIVASAIAAGASDLGENYPEEGVQKIKELTDIKEKLYWHMIGHIQSMKAILVANHFDMIHSLDSIKLAVRLDRFASQANRFLPVLLEFNLGGETSKTGLLADDETHWHEIIPLVEKISLLSHLKINGLMTMPPLNDDSELTRPYFVKLRQLQEFLAGKFPGVSWSDLSMGTSSDYAVAIQEGATIVRIGQAILGPRK